MRGKTGNTGLFILVAVIYGGLLILFGWQTWQFISWLFPDDQVLIKALSMLCFDVMAAVWAAIDLFYRHATRGTRGIVRWGWGISFILSLVASILYMAMYAFTRMALIPAIWMIDVGYAVSLIAITVTVLLVMFWLYNEWSIRHPASDIYAYEDGDMAKPATPVTKPVVVTPTPSARAALAPPIDYDRLARTLAAQLAPRDQLAPSSALPASPAAPARAEKADENMSVTPASSAPLPPPHFKITAPRGNASHDEVVDSATQTDDEDEKIVVTSPRQQNTEKIAAIGGDADPLASRAKKKKLPPMRAMK